MNQAKPLLIRADAGPRMGIGHVMRCLALAQAWQDAGGAAEFLTASDAPAVAARLREEGMQVTQATAPAGSAADAAHTASRARETRAAWVVVDGYQFDAAYQQSLKRAGLKVLWLDDYGHAGRYCADLVLNQNLQAEESLYAQREAGVRLLLGPQYALLRREFVKWRGWKREIREHATRVMVTAGGTDAGNVTSKVVSALELMADRIEATVVVGAGNPHRAAILAAIQSREQIRLADGATADLAELMAWADVAISAAGSTAWELCFMGLPALLLVAADNQSGTAQRLHQLGVAVNLGNQREVSPADLSQTLQEIQRSSDKRRTMSERGQKAVDGQGVDRVLTCIQDGPGAGA